MKKVAFYSSSRDDFIAVARRLGMVLRSKRKVELRFPDESPLYAVFVDENNNRKQRKPAEFNFGGAAARYKS